MEQRTRGGEVAAVIAAGVVAAFAIGKAPIALPELQRAFALTPVAASLVISLLALIGALTGVAVGTLADRAGHRRLMLAGLATLGLAGAAGAAAPNAGVLLATRFFEGIGFVAVVVSGPRLIVEATSDTNRRLALGLWSAYVPIGTALAMLLAPLLLHHGGWRALWLAVAIATWLAAVVIAVVCPASARDAHARASSRGDVAAVLRAPLPLALAVGFTGYAAGYLALVGFLPTMLVAAGESTALAGVVSAVIVVANGTGNVAAGFAARTRGAAPLIAVAATVMGLGAAGAFVTALPLTARLACALIGALAGGIVPACIMLSVPDAAPAPRLMATTQGLIVQGSSAGQVLGPIAVAAAGGITGGPTAAALVLGLSLVPLITARMLGARGTRAVTR